MCLACRLGPQAYAPVDRLSGLIVGLRMYQTRPRENHLDVAEQ
jgi:hypothetical protein